MKFKDIRNDDNDIDMGDPAKVYGTKDYIYIITDKGYRLDLGKLDMTAILKHLEEETTRDYVRKQNA
jgi:hypothetical protein